MLRSFHADRVRGLHAPAGLANRTGATNSFFQSPAHPSYLMETD